MILHHKSNQHRWIMNCHVTIRHTESYLHVLFSKTFLLSPQNVRWLPILPRQRGIPKMTFLGSLWVKLNSVAFTWLKVVGYPVSVAKDGDRRQGERAKRASIQVTPREMRAALVTKTSLELEEDTKGSVVTNSKIRLNTEYQMYFFFENV